MVGLVVPTIHVVASLIASGVQDVDARHEGEHDGAYGRLSKTPATPIAARAAHLSAAPDPAPR